ncbi:hypothetical protein Pth03_79410 [Planotetraspora thailandica]|uniref:Uncharacterized protein n=1 Tax=Planotetraspora thailandica TaxID=487172 RepID=A0A8J4DGE1_9ACTN|nr:hypothetical protein Pth03_79410 [Planotetraspora thailandica]
MYGEEPDRPIPHRFGVLRSEGRHRHKLAHVEDISLRRAGAWAPDTTSARTGHLVAGDTSAHAESSACDHAKVRTTALDTAETFIEPYGERYAEGLVLFVRVKA